MRAAELVLSPEGGAFPGVDELLAESPDVRREALMSLEWHADGSYALLYRINERRREPLTEALDDHPDVRRYQFLEASDATDRPYLFLHVAEHAATEERVTLGELLAITERYALLLEPPFRFTGEGVRVTVAGESTALQAAYAETAERLDVSVEWIGGYAPDERDPLARLTDRQREAVTTAHELGYYETPRRASFENVAEALECAPSTANELLRRAESVLVEELLDGRGEWESD